MTNPEITNPSDYKDKARTLWGDRRKFMSRGFIGSVILFSGSAGISRGVTQVAFNHQEDILASPHHLTRVPFYVDNLSEANSRLGNVAAKHSNNLYHTEMYIGGGCYTLGEEQDQDIIIDTPYAEPGGLDCYLSPEESLEPHAVEAFQSDSTFNGAVLDDTPEQGAIIPITNREDSIALSPDAQGISKSLIGSVTVGAGILIGRGRDKEGRINRRALLKRARNGAAVGATYHYMNKHRSSIELVQDSIIDPETYEDYPPYRELTDQLP